MAERGRRIMVRFEEIPTKEVRQEGFLKVYNSLFGEDEVEE